MSDGLDELTEQLTALSVNQTAGHMQRAMSQLRAQILDRLRVIVDSYAGVLPSQEMEAVAFGGSTPSGESVSDGSEVESEQSQDRSFSIRDLFAFLSQNQEQYDFDSAVQNFVQTDPYEHYGQTIMVSLSSRSCIAQCRSSKNQLPRLNRTLWYETT